MVIFYHALTLMKDIGKNTARGNCCHGDTRKNRTGNDCLPVGAGGPEFGFELWLPGWVLKKLAKWMQCRAKVQLGKEM